MKSPLVAFTIT